ncbi:hypothetical protein F0U62_08740 [Cystobacter fuscus]|uniref:hypothetical protein n=1 Tax=Cystobacter fuscus TaxID=43 RepID=UPI002B2C69D5|nr:hypothetical protein F0U62_08740 [Cystobacter fuscus]
MYGHQDHFLYRLLEGERVLWAREQGQDEDSPHELLVSDDGWSILRTQGYKPQVIAVSPDGHAELQVFLQGLPPRGEARGEPGARRVRRYEWHVAPPFAFMGGFYWAIDSWPYFLQVDGTACFVWRTSWGPRLVLDLTHGTLLPEDSSARAAITRAMDEEEKRGALRLLRQLAARLYEVQEFLVSRASSVRENLSPFLVQLQHVRPAMKLVGIHRNQEALPVLRFWERIDSPGPSTGTTALPSGWWVEQQCYRPTLHHSLRLLGAEPLGHAAYHFRSGSEQPRFPVPEHVPHRRERAAQLHPGMSGEQVLEQVGAPDHIRHSPNRTGKEYDWTEEWEYDFRFAEQWVTLRLTWERGEQRGRIARRQEEPASWLHADKR